MTIGEGTAEVAHEVLIRAWPTLRGWLDEDREAIRLHRQLGAAARLWDTGGRDPSDLYRGARLGAAADWAEHHREALNATECSFVDASLEEAGRERRAQLRANHRLRWLLAGAVALLLVAVLAGVVALIQRGHAQAQALTSDAERLGAQAQTEPDLDRAMLLAVAGVKLQNRVETRSDLLAALQRSPALIRLLRASQSAVSALQFSPDGRLVALGDAAGVVRFYDAASWRSRGTVRLSNPVASQAMSFSPDGHTLVVMTASGARSELHSIDVGSDRARLIRAWPGLTPTPPDPSSSVAYSPDGGGIAVSLITQSPTDPVPTAARVMMLDASTGRTRWQRRYPMHPTSKSGPGVPGQLAPEVEFTRGGLMLTSAQQGETILWSARSGRILRRFPVGGFAGMSADGRKVALGIDSDNLSTPSASVTILDLRTGRQRRLRADLPSEWIRTIAFTPDGERIAAGTTDTVHVWDVASGQIAETDNPQTGRRLETTVDPRGATVLAGSQDGSVAVFDLSGTRRLGRFFSWNTPEQGCDGPPCQVISPQDIMATDQADGTIALVDLHTLRLARTFPRVRVRSPTRSRLLLVAGRSSPAGPTGA